MPTNKEAVELLRKINYKTIEHIISDMIEAGLITADLPVTRSDQYADLAKSWIKNRMNSLATPQQIFTEVMCWKIYDWKCVLKSSVVEVDLDTILGAIRILAAETGLLKYWKLKY